MRGNEKTSSPQGLTLNMQAMRSRLRSREISERKQVGDAESMVNEEGKTQEDISS